MSPAQGPVGPLRVAVWGTGNMGRAAIRAIDGNPLLALCGVIVSNPDKVGRDAAELAGLGSPLGVAATTAIDSVLHGDRTGRPNAVAYMASGDIRPDGALSDIVRALRSGVSVVTPSIYALYDPRSAPPELLDTVSEACDSGGSSLFVSGVDPGWGNDLLPVLLSGFCSDIREIRSQEIFDYSTYDQPDAVRYLVGMGLGMDTTPPMVAPGVPSMVWGGSIRLVARALGAELDEIRETVERLPLTETVTNRLGTFDAGTQGALRFEVQGVIGGVARIIIEHVTRIDPACAPDWPQPPSGAGAHRVVIDGSPRLEVSIEAEAEGANRAAGGNATAANRLVGAVPWLCNAPAGVYDSLDVPLAYGVGRLGG